MKVLLLGAGAFSLTWLPALQNLDLTICGVADPDGDAAFRLGCSLAVPERDIFTDDRWMDSKIDLVLDTTPPSGRLSRLEVACSNGASFICAKPLCYTTREAARFLALERRTGVSILVAMQKRFLPALRTLRSKLQAGALGTPKFVKITLELDGALWKPHGVWRNALKYPSLYEGAIHHFDMLHWIFGARPHTITAQAWRWSDCHKDVFPDFSCTIICEDGLVVEYLSRWSLQTGPTTTYFSGLTVETTTSFVELRDQSLSVDGSVIVNSAGDTLETLNQRLLTAALLSLTTGTASDLSVQTHMMPISMMELTAQAIESGQTLVFDDLANGA